jgi:hypothetical protein
MVIPPILKSSLSCQERAFGSPLARVLIHERVRRKLTPKQSSGPPPPSRAIDSRHGGRKASRNGPMSWIEPHLPGKRR